MSEVGLREFKDKVSAAALAARHALRAYDAVQLAGALLVRNAEGVGFACWDDELRAAARAERIGALIPQSG